MKNEYHYSLTEFIKNVQSAGKKVGLFVQNHWWEIILLVGLIAKGEDFVTYGFLVPIYKYTDFFRDLKELLEGLFGTRCIHLRRRVRLCALNLIVN